ncbi:MFS transporter [Rhodococcus sp. MS16]|uniref:MFS transporter n=1 Tax=Rhodococcus TaxID=1827 RepID=UPI00156276F9|nr:MFS transporter [Rhodococcus globerulus]MCE4267561.1 MFS transporter [Rhodococcus globerulus]NRI68703.1 MFS transporter [Rhodococcus sp. MS16]
MDACNNTKTVLFPHFTCGPTGRMSTTFRALANPNYRLYSAGGIVSNVGIWMQRVAQDWLVLQLTDNSSIAIGITIGLQFLPTLLFGPYAGVVIDRFRKLRVLQLANLLLALVSAVTGTLAVTGMAEPWHVYVLVFTFGIVAAVEGPARQSFIPELVDPDELVNAVGLNSVSFNIARLLGPALAGLLIAALGSGVAAAGWVIIVNAFTYAAVIIALFRLNANAITAPPPTPRQPKMLRDGVRYVRDRSDIMVVLVVVWFCGAFGLNFQLSAALMATQVYGRGAGAFGLLGSCLAVGSLTGALLAARREHVTSRFVVKAAYGFALALVIAGLLPTYLSFALWAPILGVLALTVLTAANVTVQMATDPQYRGRVMALYMAVLLGGAPFGSPLLGAAGEYFGARWVLIGGGCMVFVGASLALTIFGTRSGTASLDTAVPKRH